MFVVDTNLLVYAANLDSPHHARAVEVLQQWRAGPIPWFVPWGVVYEFLRVVTHPAVLAAPLSPARAWSFVDALLAAPSLSLLVETPRHQEVLAALVEAHAPAGNLVHDAHTVALMVEHGIDEIRTADTDFHRFPGIRVVNPLRPAPEPRR